MARTHADTVLWLLVAVALGVVAGRLTMSTDEPAPVAAAPTSSVSGDLKEIDARMRRMEMMLEDLLSESELGGIVAEVLPEFVPESQMDALLNKEEPRREVVSGRTRDETCTAWVRVLHGSVARALLEAGLTPNDKGVSDLIRDAGRRLRKAGSHATARVMEINAQVKSGSLDGSGKGRLSREALDILDTTKAGILEDLEVQLRKLDQR